MAALIAGETDSRILEKKLREVLSGSGAGEEVDAQLKQLMSPGFRNSLIVDPSTGVAKCHLPRARPVRGERTGIFRPPSTFRRCVKLLQSAGNPKSEVRQFPDLNFLLQTTDTGLAAKRFGPKKPWRRLPWRQSRVGF